MACLVVVVVVAWLFDLHKKMLDSYNYSLGCETAGRWLHLRCLSRSGNWWSVATWLSVLHAWETGDLWRLGFQFCMHG